MTERRYSVILLDVDGTLLDFRLCAAEAMAQAAAACGLSLPPEANDTFHAVNDELWRRLERGEEPRRRDAAERVDVLLRLGARMCDQKPERLAMCELRKFCTWYLEGLTGAGEVCGRVHRVEQLDELRRVLEQYLNGLIAANDAHVHPELLPEATLDTVDDAARRCGCSVLF